MKYKVKSDGKFRYFDDIYNAYAYAAIQRDDVIISKHKRTFASPTALARAFKKKGIEEHSWSFTNEV